MLPDFPKRKPEETHWGWLPDTIRDDSLVEQADLYRQHLRDIRQNRLRKSCPISLWVNQKLRFRRELPAAFKNFFLTLSFPLQSAVLSCVFHSRKL